MIIALLVAAALAGSGDPEGVIATAPTGSGAVIAEAAAPYAPSLTGAAQTAPHGLTTDQQIDRWLQSSVEEHDVAPFTDADQERRIQGEIEAGIGTDGYRGFSASVDVPVGRSSWLSLHVAKETGDLRTDPYAERRRASDPYFD